MEAYPVRKKNIQLCLTSSRIGDLHWGLRHGGGSAGLGWGSKDKPVGTTNIVASKAAKSQTQKKQANKGFRKKFSELAPQKKRKKKYLGEVVSHSGSEGLGRKRDHVKHDTGIREPIVAKHTVGTKGEKKKKKRGTGLPTSSQKGPKARDCTGGKRASPSSNGERGNPR